MGSSALTSTWRNRTTPCIAILHYELRALAASWLVRLWLPATALLAFVQLAGNWNQQESAPLIAAMLFPYLVFPWSLVVMVLSVSPVSGRTMEVADGILSRSVTRHAYLLACWSARVLMVAAVYLAVALPALSAVAFAARPVPDDEITLYGALAALLVVGLVLAFLVSMGFLLGTLLRNQLLAVVVLAFLWFPVNGVLHTFSLEEFSPISLNQALPTLLRQPYSNARRAELAQARDAARGMDRLMNLFDNEPAGQAREADFFDSGKYEDFRLSRVLLGYGIPAFTALLLAVFCFGIRDL